MKAEKDTIVNSHLSIYALGIVNGKVSCVLYSVFCYSIRYISITQHLPFVVK